MPVLKNTNPLGDIELYDVGFIKAGAEFKVSEERAARLLKQRGNYALVTPKPAEKKKD